MAGSGSPADPGIGHSYHPLQLSRGLPWLATLRPDAGNTQCCPGRSVSRGYGRWQAELVRAVGGVHTATVAGVVRTCVPEPDRSDYVAARRAARTLALEETLVALYVYACQRCGQVQDHEPERCCGVVRSSLAVTRPGRTLPHLALPPLGRRCPAWIGPNVASRPPSPPGTLATPSVAEVASLAVRRCYEGLQSGRPAVSVRDVAALLKLQREIEHDDALAERDAARRQMEEWKAGLQLIRNAIVRQYGQDAWAAISAEIRKHRPAAHP